MAFLGIDQSLNATGLCRLLGDAVEASATVSPNNLTGGERLLFIKRAVAGMLTGVSAVAMEGYSYDSVGRVFELGEVGGVIKVLLVESGIPHVVVAPAQLKKFATGRAQATKERMVAAAACCGFATEDDNQADAFHLARVARAVALGDLEGRPRRELEVARDLRDPKPKKPARRARRLVKAAV